MAAGTPPTEAQAIEWCLSALDARAYTRAELLALLNRKGVLPETSGPLLDRYAEVGLLDDAAFAADWVESRRRSKGLAGRALVEELKRKGISAEAATEAVASVDASTELATARSLVERKLGATRGLAPDARARRLAGMLARKGYSGGVAWQAVREAVAAEQESAELDDLMAGVLDGLGE